MRGVPCAAEAWDSLAAAQIGRSAMPRTRKGKRTAKLQVQIVEERNGEIKMYLKQFGLPPIAFDPQTGQSGPQAHEKLLQILDQANEEGI